MIAHILRWLIRAIMVGALSTSAVADRLVADGHDQEQLCAALRNIDLYLDRNQGVILARAQSEIIKQRKLAAFEATLQTTAVRLQTLYAAGCLRTRSARLEASPVAVDAPLRLELAAVRREVQAVGTYAPADFRTPVFQCVGDFEVCKTALSDEFGCGITFMICVGQQLIPFAAKAPD